MRRDDRLAGLAAGRPAAPMMTLSWERQTCAELEAWSAQMEPTTSSCPTHRVRADKALSSGARDLELHGGADPLGFSPDGRWLAVLNGFGGDRSVVLTDLAVGTGTASRLSSPALIESGVVLRSPSAEVVALSAPDRNTAAFYLARSQAELLPIATPRTAAV
jgi:hypothetical protein